jgi:hypothetical protein
VRDRPGRPQVGVKAEGVAADLSLPLSSLEATEDPTNSYPAVTAVAARGRLLLPGRGGAAGRLAPESGLGRRWGCDPRHDEAKQRSARTAHDKRVQGMRGRRVAEKGGGRLRLRLRRAKRCRVETN